MIEPFGLEHIWLLKKLGKEGKLLGLHRTMVRPGSAFWRALSSTLYLHEQNTMTWMFRERFSGGPQTGMVQLAERPGRPEAEIIFISPALSQSSEASALWLRLLTQTAIQAGEHGYQRLFAHSDCSNEELELFRQVGFVIYTREQVLRLELAAGGRRTPPPGTRRLRSADEARLMELYLAVTPRLVQAAEGNCPCEWHMPANHQVAVWGEEAYVLESSHTSTIDAYIQIKPGRHGHWMELVVGPEYRDGIDALLDFGLGRVSAWSPKPLFTAVREYQGGILPALHARGFEPFARQASMVKYTTVLIKDPLTRVLAALDKRVDPSTPTVTLLNGEAEPASQPVRAVAGPCRD